MLHLSQERLGKWLERGQFVCKRRVEHHIRIFLEREDVPLLTAPHGFPAADGLRGAVAAFTRVTHNATDESRVSGGNAVVAVQVQLSQSRDVDPKYFILQIVGDKSRIKAVDTFQDDGLSTSKLDNIPRLAHPGLEVVARQLNFISPDQFFQITCKQGKIKRFNRFEIRLSIFIERRFGTVEKIII